MDQPASATLDVPVALVDSVDDVLIPVTSADTTTAVRRALKMRWRSDASSEVVCSGIQLEFDRAAAPELADVSSAIALDLLRNDEVLGTLRVQARGRMIVELWCADMEYKWASAATPDWRLALNLPIECEGEFDNPENIKHWRIRVRGDGEMALTDWAYDKYWAGEFTVPLKDIMAHD